METNKKQSLKHGPKNRRSSSTGRHVPISWQLLMEATTHPALLIRITMENWRVEMSAASKTPSLRLAQ
jgi:hypothetical protein